MAAEDDDKRKTHFFRVLGKTPDGDDKDTWIDLERLEYIRTREGGGPDFIRTHHKLEWYEDDAGKVPNPARKTSILKVIPPDDDPDNPALWFEVDVNEKIKIRDFDQIIYVHFDNSADNHGREVVVRRIVHYDTTADDLPQYKDGGVIPRQDYQKIKSTKDKEQYVDIEIIEKRRFRDADQKTRARYNIQVLIDASEAPDRSYGEGEINPPWRLDPLQTIVNVNFAPTVIVVFLYRPGGGGSAVSLHESAKYLGKKPTGTGSDAHVFKVNAGLGEFAKTTASSDATSVSWFVLPWIASDDEDANIARAMTAVEQIVSANIFEDPLDVLSPKGVLWRGEIFRIQAGSSQTWKTAYTKHRLGSGDTLPNKMVQCFPLDSVPVSFTDGDQLITVKGFNIHFYRLDRKGEDAAYDPPPEWANDVVYTQTAPTGSNFGCKFQTDLPSVGADRAYTNIFGTRGIADPPG